MFITDGGRGDQWQGVKTTLPSVIARKHLQGEKVHLGGLGRMAVLTGSRAVVVSHVCLVN